MSGRRGPAGPAEVLDRTRPVDFTFDGRRRRGLAGDTIGSALAADGVDVLSRSFKYHRPRGLLCCAGRCPNCLVDVDGTPNVRACVTPLQEGMRIRSQNARPSLRWDVMALADRFSRLLPTGFYYKTFIRPRRLWPLYERVLRHAAGIGRVDPTSRPDLHVRRRHLHVDVAVLGGGPAGCLAALEAAASGARVVLVDDGRDLGGHLLVRTRPIATSDERVAAGSGIDVARRLAALVAGDPRIEHLAEASALGIYAGGLVAVAQGATLIRVRARSIVVATGATEVPALFDGNDRPGIMLASGILRLRHLHGVVPGRRCVVVTDDDHGWDAALELIQAGIAVVALVDARDPDVVAAAERPHAAALEAAGVGTHQGSFPVAARGRHRVSGLAIDGHGGTRSLECDLVALAMHREPVIALAGQAGARASWDTGLGAFVATDPPDGVFLAGHVLDPKADEVAFTSAKRAGRAAAAAALGTSPDIDPEAAGGSTGDEREAPDLPNAEQVALSVPGGRKQFVCVCEDVTVKELSEGFYEGFTDLETLKRYSTVTMGSCQGKMCHSLVSRLHARLSDASPARSGLTTSRPPWQPIELGVLAGPHHAPVRRTAIHERHAELGATWIDMGEWKRPLHYGDVGAECTAVRTAAGLIDVSTLGKLEVQGPDAAAFLDWLHPNRFSDLSIGRVRYRAMLDESGIILDDGTVARLGDERFLVTTGTGTLDAVDQWLRWWLAGSDRDVFVTDVTSQLAAVNLAGPRSREILARVTELDVSRAAMPYLAATEGIVAGIPAVILRIGFVGELAFEIHVPSDRGARLWDALTQAGGDLGLRPFGVEAQRVLRLEKQHAIVGQDTDALSNPLDAGMGWLVKRDKPDWIGRDATLALDADGERPRRTVLAGFATAGPEIPAEGAAIVRDGRSVGRVTSSKWSTTLGRPIGLAWIPVDDAVDGTPIMIRLGVGADGATTSGEVRTRPFYDPDGERLRT